MRLNEDEDEEEEKEEEEEEERKTRKDNSWNSGHVDSNTNRIMRYLVESVVIVSLCGILARVSSEAGAQG
ncbi:hypothetical protein M0802_010910 [Mischocyttarus mexicanus]|nr:hypothetical protein M0802_010910 [Mischocyttarus mexicanus]